MGRSFRVLKRDPQILIYPYLAIIFILLTYPIVGRFVFSMWYKVQYPQVVSQVTKDTPHQLLVHFGLVTFSVFYTIFVTAYFISAMSSVVLAKLEDRKVPTSYGLRIIFSRFFRITKFALLAIFFFPLGIAAQRKKFRSLRGAFEAISSSFSLSMSQLAPAIVTGQKGVFNTVCDAVETLGTAWRQSLVIRIGTFVAILLLGSISFLPKLIELYWFDDHSAQVVGWVLTALVGASTYVIIRIVGAVFTTTLYFEAKNRRTKT